MPEEFIAGENVVHAFTVLAVKAEDLIERLNLKFLRERGIAAAKGTHYRLNTSELLLCPSCVHDDAAVSHGCWVHLT
jgi:hypothetical protein